MKKKRSEDERVTAPLISWRLMLVLLAILFVLVIAQFYIVKGLMGHIPALIVTLTNYIFWTCLALTIAVGYFWRYVVSRPLRQLTSGVRRVASGDFDVQIAPAKKKSSRKNEVDVLVDDFNKMTRELQENEMMRSDFISNVSHEIKTPVAVIQSYSKALKDPALPEETRQQYTDTVINASQMLNVMVTNILKLNKLEHQEIYPDPRPYQLGEQLRKCALAYMERWEAKNITFHIDVADVVITNQASLLELVWNNLLSNAVKYTKEDGSISLTSKAEGNSVRVKVEDNGIGMSEETQKRIFDKFYQADPSRSSEGTGLGLALVKKILDITGGTIQVESEEGKGSAFTVTLPV